MASIPVVDISAFITNDSAESRKCTAKLIAEALKMNGFAGITGHGLTDKELERAFTATKSLFALPEEEKMKAPHPGGPTRHRGYLATSVEKSGQLGVIHTKSEEEKAFYQRAIDWKETYDIGHEENHIQENIWLPEEVFPNFRTEMINLFKRLSSIARAILEALILGMDLSKEDSDTLRQLHSPIDHQMRLAHYLPMTRSDEEDAQKIRLAAHKDFSSFTMVFQEPSAADNGLEFQDRQTGQYIHAEPKAGMLYLNIGDLMSIYSNGHFPSAMHKVGKPVFKKNNTVIPSRYSIPFFVNLSPETLVYPMPSLVASDGHARFEANKYQDLMLRLFSSALPQ